MLHDDNWDDYHYKTLFKVKLIDDHGDTHDLGTVKIMRAGMAHGRIEIPDVFSELGDEYCSLGQSQNYYETLAILPEYLRHDYLRGIRDCVFDPNIWEKFKNEDAMNQSLLRSVSPTSVTITFPGALSGEAEVTPFHFIFGVDDGTQQSDVVLDVDVDPRSLPPTNVHAVIGPNGVGKTRLFAGLSHKLIGSDDPTGFAVRGNLSFQDKWGFESEKFANLVTVSFSAFDSFQPIEESESGSIRCNYVGLKRRHRPGEDYVEEEIVNKSSRELRMEFLKSLQTCLVPPRRDRFTRMMDYLSSDSGIAGLEIPDLIRHESDDDVWRKLHDQFDTLSSGPRIVLLASTKLVELVDERTLVLIDEPESHLHPPLLGSFVRAIADLLSKRNGVCIFATHSPVVLQEIPRSCVTLLSRSGDLTVSRRPEIETFAENVGTLTREVFGLEVSASGHHKLLAEASRDAEYEVVLDDFGGQIGAEGKALVRALTSTRKRG